MNKESIAKIELDKAYDRLLKNSNLTKEFFELMINNGIKSDEIFNNIKYFSKYGLDAKDLAKEYLSAKERGKVLNVDDFLKSRRDLVGDIKKLEKIGVGSNAVIDLLDGQNTGRVLVGDIYDGGIMVASKLIPGIGQIALVFDALSLIDKLTGGDGTTFDLRTKAQKLYDKLTNTTSDLLIVKDELNSIRIKDYFLLNYYKEPVNAISAIKFANKDTLSIADIDKALILNASDNSDDIATISSKSFTINTKGGDDVITTNGGDDYIDGGSGNDTLQGGYGDDILIGKTGNDTYIFGEDFGNDTIIEENSDKNVIKFTNGISKDDLLFKKLNNDLVILQNKNSVNNKTVFY